MIQSLCPQEVSGYPPTHNHRGQRGGDVAGGQPDQIHLFNDMYTRVGWEGGELQLPISPGPVVPTLTQ